MAQFDVWTNPGRFVDEIPYLIEVQSDFLAQIRTTVVAPLARRRIVQPAQYLNPEFEIDGEGVVMLIQELTAVSRTFLPDRPVSNVSDARDEIIRAVDFLIVGI